MRESMDIFEGLASEFKLKMIEMDLVEFSKEFHFNIHPLFRKMYNLSHIGLEHFNLNTQTSSERYILHPINKSNYHNTTNTYGEPALILAVGLDSTLIITKKKSDHVKVVYFDMSGEHKTEAEHSAQEFIDNLLPVISSC